MTPCSESCTYERDASPAFVFDLMEPEQPKVDRAILSFLKSGVLHPADLLWSWGVSSK
jgi:hypothetical protein